MIYIYIYTHTYILGITSRTPNYGKYVVYSLLRAMQDLDHQLYTLSLYPKTTVPECPGLRALLLRSPLRAREKAVAVLRSKTPKAS